MDQELAKEKSFTELLKGSSKTFEELRGSMAACMRDAAFPFCGATAPEWQVKT
jgi:hypothetical protein